MCIFAQIFEADGLKVFHVFYKRLIYTVLQKLLEIAFSKPLKSKFLASTALSSNSSALISEIIWRSKQILEQRDRNGIVVYVV